jgi:hypothetical protein
MDHLQAPVMKRFTETQKWDDPWFRKLQPRTKLLWLWLLDRCDNAGVIDFDHEMLCFLVGFQYPLDALSELGDRVIKLPCGKLFIPKFIEFQYGVLSRDCKAHNPVFHSLEKHQIKGYSKGIDTLQEKDKEKEKVKAKAKDPNARVSENSALMVQIGKWFGRKESNLWTRDDADKLTRINPDPEDLENMENWFSQPKSEVVRITGHDARQTALTTLLNNWQTAADRARTFKADYNP